jgi:hypothetical protein
MSVLFVVQCYLCFGFKYERVIVTCEWFVVLFRWFIKFYCCFLAGIVLGGTIAGAIYDRTSTFRDVFLFVSFCYLLGFLWDEVMFTNASIWRSLAKYWGCRK